MTSIRARATPSDTLFSLSLSLRLSRSLSLSILVLLANCARALTLILPLLHKLWNSKNRLQVAKKTTNAKVTTATTATTTAVEAVKATVEAAVEAEAQQRVVARSLLGSPDRLAILIN